MAKKITYFLLRVSMGWLMFYAGITKILDSEWSAGAYIANAKTFSGFYGWLASSSALPIVNFFNEWGLTLIGASLILGFLVKISSPFGALLMLLYYFPILEFPRIGQHSYIIDSHIIYALVFAVLFIMNAGKYWGLDSYRISKR